MSKTVKFRIQVQGPKGNTWWEEEERVVGSQNRVRGYGEQPEFTGDINKWGEDIVAWFNRDEPKEKHRKFIKAELVDMPKAEKEKP